MIGDVSTVYKDGSGAWFVNFEQTNIYGGFPSQVHAQRFLDRLWRGSAGIYFIGGEDGAELSDAEVAEARAQAEVMPSAIYGSLVSKGYGDMEWCLSDECGEDSIHFDYEILDGVGKGYAAVQVTIDCNSGGFTQDSEACVVKITDLGTAMSCVVDLAMDWFSDNYPEEHETIFLAGQELKGQILKAVACALVRNGYCAN